MNNYVLLNNVEHKNLKVATDFSAKYGDNVSAAITFPQEFRAIQAQSPIFFSKNNETGKFFPVALLGVRDGENLFLTDKGWDANYVPISIKRNPFLIGYQRIQIDGELKNNPVIYVDMDSPRINVIEGESVFLPHGGNTPYLETVATMLEYISIGDQTSVDFMETLSHYDLIEPISIDIELKNGEKNRLVGYYTINEEKLATLSAEVLAALHSKSYLIYIYMVLASMSNMENLIERVEARIAGASA